jgi:cholesterol oxidase
MWILNFIAENNISNVVFLSGDEHMCVNTVATLSDGSHGAQPRLEVRSIHSSGMYSPFSFANGRPEDFVDEDYASHSSNTWHVRSAFAPAGQGFAVIRVSAGNAQKPWTMRVTFDLDTGGMSFQHKQSV